MFVHCEAVRDQQLYGNVHKIIQIHKNIQIQPLKLLNSNTRILFCARTEALSLKFENVG